MELWKLQIFTSPSFPLIPQSHSQLSGRTPLHSPFSQYCPHRWWIYQFLSSNLPSPNSCHSPSPQYQQNSLGISKSLPEKQVSYLQILPFPPIFQGSQVWASSEKQGGQQKRQVNFVTSFSLPFLQIQYRVSSPPVAVLSSGTFFRSLASK